MDGWKAILLAGLATLALKVGDTLVKAFDRYVDHQMDHLTGEDEEKQDET